MCTRLTPKLSYFAYIDSWTKCQFYYLPSAYIILQTGDNLSSVVETVETFFNAVSGDILIQELSLFRRNGPKPIVDRGTMKKDVEHRIMILQEMGLQKISIAVVVLIVYGILLSNFASYHTCFYEDHGNVRQFLLLLHVVWCLL